MSDVLLIRHGVTAWNAARRIQGRRDLPLTAEARAWLRTRRLPDGFEAAEWQASPLTRAQQTARLLGARSLVLDERLLEMDWGEWEGMTLDGMRATAPAAFTANEARGIDFRPPGGESPRDVAARLAGWFGSLARARAPVAAVTHKGVIRAALALATGWDMREDFAQRLDWRAVQHFRVDGPPARGGVSVVTLNRPLPRR